MAAGISLLPEAEPDYNSDRLPSVIAHGIHDHDKLTKYSSPSSRKCLSELK